MFGVVAAALLVGCGAAGPDDDRSGSSTMSTVAPALTATTVHRVGYPVRSGLADPTQNWGDLYLPAGPQRTDSIPLVVLIHGGSWRSPLDAQTMAPYARDLASRGMAVYNIEYRRLGSGGGWPTTFSDVADALDNVPTLDQSFPQITTDDELVVGHSAGAQLAMWAGTRNTLSRGEIGSSPKFRPTRVVALAGPLDMVFAAHHGNDRIVAVLGGTPEQVPDRYRQVDPAQNIETSIPVVAIHGTADTLVPPILSERFIGAVDRAGGHGDLIFAEGEDHVSVVDPRSRVYGKILDVISDASRDTIESLDRSYDGPTRRW